MNSNILTTWFDDEGAAVLSYLIMYCLCYLAMMFVIDHFGKGRRVAVSLAGYSPSVLTNSPTQLETSVVKAGNG